MSKMQRKSSFRGRFWTRRVIRQHGYGYYKCYYCGNNSTGPDRYEITFMKYHPYILSEITRWNFSYLEGNLCHILDRSEKNMDIVSINFKCAWEMSQKCTSTTCAFKTYYDILVCINFRAADEKEEGELNAKSTTKSVWIIPSSAFWCWSGTRHLTSKKSSSSRKWVREPD